MENFATARYTAVEIAAALAGKVAVWAMINAEIKNGKALDSICADVTGELDRMAKSHLIVAGTVKSAKKTLANIKSLLRRAAAANVSAWEGDKLKGQNKLEKECHAKENPEQATAPASDEATAPASDEATAPASDEATAPAVDLTAENARLVAENARLVAILEQIKGAASIKEVRAILAA